MTLSICSSVQEEKIELEIYKRKKVWWKKKYARNRANDHAIHEEKKESFQKKRKDAIDQAIGQGFLN